MEAILNTVRQGLTKLGHTVFCASSGEEGLKLLRENPVHAVVSDLGMPHMNGWDVGRSVKELAEKSGSPKTPLILMTGWGGQVLSAEKAKNCGVDKIVEKPVDIPRLIDTVREIQS